MSIVEPLSPTSAEFKGILPLNIIYEAGVDSESRPILVLCACNLPDPNTTNYDLILGFILGRLNEFVESDYVLVFFSSPAQYRPSWMWLLKAYRALDRRYKKNLKALYVVHLTRTYRLIFDLANKITSPKFARKLRYCSTLQELFGSIQISAQFIPQQVRKYDAQLPPMPPSPSRYSISAENKRPLPSLTFGLTLEELAALEGWEKNEARTRYIPRVVQQLTAHLRSEGLEKEGIFRKSPASDELQMVKRELNQGIEVNLSHHDVNVSASLLKIFLKELPLPLIDSDLCASLGKLPDPADCSPEVLDKIKARFQEAYNDKPHHLALLQYLFEFFQQVASHADKNRMTAHNLAVVLTPNLVRGSSSPQDPFTPASQQEAMATAANYLKEMNMGMALVQILIVHHKQIFSNSG